MVQTICFNNHYDVKMPWMWALNGAASVSPASSPSMISTETSIKACVLTGAACYAIGGILLSGKESSAAAKADLVDEAKPLAAL